MKVTEAVVEELARQGVLEIMADEGFDPVEMARAVIKAADADAYMQRPIEAVACLSSTRVRVSALHRPRPGSYSVRQCLCY